ncbi:MAG: hypothetical protein AAGF23_12165 [Acidobacteriota bacterium]
MPVRSPAPFRFATLALVAALGGLFPPTPVAADAFLIDDDGPLYRFDFPGQSFELLGDTGLENGALALAPDGQLFSASDTGLHRIDPVDGSSTSVGPWGESIAVSALAFDPSGELFMAADGDLFVVDPSTAGRTLLGTPTPSPQALAYADGRLLAIGVLGQAWSLYSVNRIDGDLTEISPIPQIAPQDNSLVTFVSMDADATGDGLNIAVASFSVIGLPPSAFLSIDRLDLSTRELEPVAGFTVDPSIPFATGIAGRVPTGPFMVEVPAVGGLGAAALGLLLAAAGLAALRRR